MKIDYKYIIATCIILLLFGWAIFSKTSKQTINQSAFSTTQSSLESSSSAVDVLTSHMKLTFDEEFNTFSQYRDPAGKVTCGSNGTGTWQTIYFGCTRSTLSNNETEIYFDQTPFHLSDGVLSIEAAPTDPYVQSVIGLWAQYSSGIITTQYSFSQTYGYFEARIELPAGPGLWPAFWLLPVDKSWPPEIDAMEAFGDTNPVKGEGGRTLIHYASHTAPDNQICGAWYETKTDVTAGFHTYGVDWEPNAITYYFDGSPYATCPPNPSANKPFYMLINLAVGGAGSWPGTTDATNVWPAVMRIDYVRAWQKE